MTNLLAARSQMAMSLGFHIIFAVVGIGMPLLMVIAETLYLRTKNVVFLELAKRWSKGTAIMFAVGAVSGTVLSFELGLLWPKFMAFAGPIIGMPFSLEGFAFFLEAIFLGIFLYGWERVPPMAHLFSGIMVLVCGTLSGIFVVCANAWMNSPAGFIHENGRVVGIDPFQAMFNPMWFPQTLHMTLAAFVSVGFVVAGIHARQLLKNPGNLFHRYAFAIALGVGAIFIPIQILSGDIASKYVAVNQPVKLAAMEGQWETQSGAPLRIFGWPDEINEQTNYAIELPYLLSLLAFNDPHATIQGLKEVPKLDRPPVAITHVAFQLMVGSGLLMLLVAIVGAWLKWQKRQLHLSRWFLWLVIFASPFGFIAIEAGWTVTELGRQPWVIYNLMRTADAVTPMPHLIIPFTLFSCLYLFLSVVVVYLLKRQVFMSPLFEDEAR